MIRGKKILGALLAFTLCFSMVIPAQADDISDAKKKQQELEQQKNTAEAEKSELSSELDSIVSKMEKTQSDLTAKETEINDAETELVTAKANEDDQYQTMKLRIKYMYENGSNEFLEILMEANSIADLLNKAEYINKISKCDRELLVEYEDTRKDVENRENALKKEYAELESLQDELAGEQANVEKLLADKNIQIDNLTSEISSNADKLKQLIAAAEAAEARRKEAEATAAAQAAQAAAAAQASASSGTSSSGGSGNTSSNASATAAAQAAQAAAAASSGTSSSGNASATGTGSLTHPVPGAAITSGFGGRVAPTAGATTGHDGIDYGAGYGAAVYAADSGTVITAQYNSARGNYIVINHGNGMQTWYQHLSSMNVTVGQTVARGQVIGNVGTTGISTGPHLHFEVHVGGVPVNPLNYL